MSRVFLPQFVVKTATDSIRPEMRDGARSSGAVPRRNLPKLSVSGAELHVGVVVGEHAVRIRTPDPRVERPQVERGDAGERAAIQLRWSSRDPRRPRNDVLDRDEL